MHLGNGNLALGVTKLEFSQDALGSLLTLVSIHLHAANRTELVQVHEPGAGPCSPLASTHRPVSSEALPAMFNASKVVRDVRQTARLVGLSLLSVGTVDVTLGRQSVVSSSMALSTVTCGCASRSGSPVHAH